MIPTHPRPLAFTALAALLGPLAADAGIAAFPGIGTPTYDQAYVDAAVANARAQGRQEAAAECLADPGNCGCNDGLAPCGVSTASTLPNALYGETEPNDHMVAADPLVSTAKYWGQSQSLDDQDWFYVTTNEPNQVLTLNFTVPDRVLTSPDRLTQGWLISVKDAAGNDYAKFDTRFALDDPTTAEKNESKEITYPVFLGHQGTYYVVVQPQLADASGTPITTTVGQNLNDLSVLYAPYNLVAVLDYSQLDNAPPDVNFHDVEIEPNDTDAQANALTTGVTLYGALLMTRDPTSVQTVGGAPQYLQADQDWYKYHSDGNEQVVLAWCGMQDCEKGTWYVEVRQGSATGQILASGNTTEAGKTFNFGIKDPGDYYLHVDFKRDLNATCLEYSDTGDPSVDLNCTGRAEQCQQLTVTAAATTSYATCTYAAGNGCGDTQQSDNTTSDANCNAHPGSTGCSIACARTDLGESSAITGHCSITTTTTCTQDSDCPAGPPAETCTITSNAPVNGYPLWKWAESCTAFERVCLKYGQTQDLADTLSASYNFTWWGTKLLPLTNGTPAFEGFQERPAFYQSR